MLVADRFGGRIVVEYIDGELTVFEAPLGVITNSPNYDWHMTNLNKPEFWISDLIIEPRSF